MKVPAKVIDKVKHAIRKHNKPCSLQLIKKTLQEDFGYDNAKQITKNLKENPAVFQAHGGKYWFNGEDLPKEEGPEVIIKEEEGSGGGSKVSIGDTIFIDYKLFLQSNPKKCIETGKKFSFVVGNKDVIKGMDAGVLGMAVGSKREIVVPWQLGYGKKGSAPDIPSEADLIFKIERVCDPAEPCNEKAEVYVISHHAELFLTEEGNELLDDLIGTENDDLPIHSIDEICIKLRPQTADLIESQGLVEKLWCKIDGGGSNSDGSEDGSEDGSKDGPENDQGGADELPQLADDENITGNAENSVVIDGLQLRAYAKEHNIDADTLMDIFCYAHTVDGKKTRPQA